MTRAPTDRSHLSIGEVLSLLQEEFPDVTISKIRFLESQGLLDPERTPSGYRKFYETDIERLRAILRLQKEQYLPLKVIRDRLDETGPVRTAPTSASPDVADHDAADGAEGRDDDEDHEPAMAAGTRRGEARNGGMAAVALDERPPTSGRPGGPTPAPAARPPDARPAARRRPDEARRTTDRSDVAEVIEAPPAPPPPPTGADPTLVLGPSRPAAEGGPGPRRPARRRARADADAEAGAVSLTAEELIQASGLPPRALRELEGFGLLESDEVGGTRYYDGEALVIARTAAGFLEHGIEARHIRSYKVSVEREAGLFEQIVLPLLKQRNPDAKRKAAETVADLVRLGDDMRSVLLRRGLREHIPPL